MSDNPANASLKFTEISHLLSSQGAVELVFLGSDVIRVLGFPVSLWDFCIFNVALGLKEEICQCKSLQLGRQFQLVNQVFLIFLQDTLLQNIFSKGY